MYIIQTNTSYNNENKPIDFQSMMYKVTSIDWNEFKEHILTPEQEVIYFIRSTMMGCKRPKYAIIQPVVNDDFHLEVNIIRYDSTKQNVKYYMVSDEQFNNLL
jgi:hypothetical protein